jgi:hypothetical protein
MIIWWVEKNLKTIYHLVNITMIQVYKNHNVETYTSNGDRIVGYEDWIQGNSSPHSPTICILLEWKLRFQSRKRSHDLPPDSFQIGAKKWAYTAGVLRPASEWAGRPRSERQCFSKQTMMRFPTRTRALILGNVEERIWIWIEIMRCPAAPP